MSVKFWHDWQFLKVNWIDFTFVRLYYERDLMTGMSEFAAGLLGLRVSFGWVHDRELVDSWLKKAQDAIGEKG